MKIHRVGEIWQAAFYGFREHAFDFPVKRIKKKGIELHLTEGQHNDERPICALPKDSKVTEEDRRAIMTYSFCGEALGCVYNLARQLLDGKSAYSQEELYQSNRATEGLHNLVEEILFVPKNLEYKVVLTDKFGERDNYTHMGHEILRVWRKRGKPYVLDITGAQFSFYDTVVSWEEYEQKRVNRIIRIRRFGSNHDLVQGTIQKVSRPKMAYLEAHLHLVKQNHVFLRAKAMDIGIRIWLETEKVSALDLLKEPNNNFYVHLKALCTHIDQSLSKYNKLAKKKPPVTAIYGGGDGKTDPPNVSSRDIAYEMELRGAMKMVASGF